MMTVSRPMLGEFYNFVQSAYDLVVNLLSGPSFFSVVSRLFAYSSLCAFAIKRDGTDALSSAFFQNVRHSTYWLYTCTPYKLLA